MMLQIVVYIFFLHYFLNKVDINAFETINEQYSIHECKNTDDCKLIGMTYKCINTINNGSICVDECSSYNCSLKIPSNSIAVQDSFVNFSSIQRPFCETGYVLQPDNNSCVDINECSLNRNLCMFSCINKRGSYECLCPTGYKPSIYQKSSCIDIDECTSGNVCHPNQICINTRGSYKCSTITCPQNYVRHKIYKNHCVKHEKFCTSANISSECINGTSSMSFYYITLPSNLPIPDKGQISLLRIQKPSKFVKYSSLQLKNVTYLKEPKITENFFKLIRSDKLIEVALVKDIIGPQEIELNLKIIFYFHKIISDNLKFEKVLSGVSKLKIFIYISEYEF